MSAKDKLLKKLRSNVGKLVSRDELRKASEGVSEWARPVRFLRQEGWDIKAVVGPKGGYILRSAKKRKGVVREPINMKTRVMVFSKDGYRCVFCGRNPREDNIKLVIDHVTPVEYRGTNDILNLQTLCTDCNSGKKHFLKDESPEVVTKVFAAKSDKGRLRAYFEGHLDEEIPVSRLKMFVKGEEWKRALRFLREEGFRIKYLPADGRRERRYIAHKKL
jgi:hypothetical protein